MLLLFRPDTGEVTPGQQFPESLSLTDVTPVFSVYNIDVTQLFLLAVSPDSIPLTLEVTERA